MSWQYYNVGTWKTPYVYLKDFEFRPALNVYTGYTVRNWTFEFCRQKLQSVVNPQKYNGRRWRIWSIDVLEWVEFSPESAQKPAGQKPARRGSKALQRGSKARHGKSENHQVMMWDNFISVQTIHELSVAFIRFVIWHILFPTLQFHGELSCCARNY